MALKVFCLAPFPKFAEFFPGTPPISNPEFLIWKRQDQLLVPWLLASISDSILVTIVGLQSSNQIWTTLESSFASQSRARIVLYKLQIQTLKNGFLTMREFMTKMKTFADVLASAVTPFMKRIKSFISYLVLVMSMTLLSFQLLLEQSHIP